MKRRSEDANGALLQMANVRDADLTELANGEGAQALLQEIVAPSARLGHRSRASFQQIKTSDERPTIKQRARATRIVRRASGLTAAAAIAVALVVGPGMIPRGNESNAAAATLRGLAQAARDEPISVVGPDQFLYTKSRARSQNCDGSGCVWQLAVEERWVAHDGSGRFAGQDGDDPAFSEVVGPGELGGSLNEAVPPTDIDELRDFVGERAGQAEQPLNYEMFVVIRDLLVETWSSPLLYSTPELRASLFEVASTLPGVEDLGPKTDDIGRPGVGVGFTKDGVRMELIFDPVTGAMLGHREYRLASDGAERMNRGGWGVFVEVGVVDSIRDRP